MRRWHLNTENDRGTDSAERAFQGEGTDLRQEQCDRESNLGVGGDEVREVIEGWGAHYLGLVDS